MHKCASTVVDVYRRHPRPALSKLHDAAARHHRSDHAATKPRAVAVHTSWQSGHDRQPCGEVSVEALEGRCETLPPGEGTRRVVLGDRSRAEPSVATCV